MSDSSAIRSSTLWAALLLVAISCGLVSCATTQPSSDTSEEPVFRPIGESSDPDAAKRLASAKLEVVSGGYSIQAYRHAASTIRRDLRTSPDAATFYIDQQIGQRAQLQKSPFLADRSNALETLLASGRGDLLPDYWQQVNGDAPFFSEKWAIAAMTWYAEYHPATSAGAFSQRELARYWSLGCLPQVWNMENDVNIVNMVLTPVVGRRCQPDANRTGRYLSLYVKGGSGSSPDRIAEAVSLASDMGRRHLEAKNLGTAAGWYTMVLNLDAAAPGAFSGVEAGEVFRQLYRPGWTFRVDGQVVTVGQMRFDAMRVAQSRNQARVADAARNLRLIQDAGVTTIQPF